MDDKEKNPLLSKNTNYTDSYKKTSSTESSDTENWSDGSSSSYYSDSDRCGYMVRILFVIFSKNNYELISTVIYPSGIHSFKMMVNWFILSLKRRMKAHLNQKSILLDYFLR